MIKDNVLIIGFGSIGKQHCSVITKHHKKLRLIVVSKHKKPNIKNNIVFENSVKKALKNYKFLAAIICSPSPNHYKEIIMLLSKKINVLVEKPLFNEPISKRSKNKILYLLKKNKVTLQVGYLLRFHPLIQFLKNEISSYYKNNFINVKMITNSYLPNWRSTPYQKSVSAQKKFGGGVLNELSHEIDLIIYLFAKPKELFARSINTKKLDINVEDVSSVVLRTKKKINIFLHLDFSKLPEQRLIEIESNKASLKLDLNNGIFIKKNKKTSIKKKTKIRKNTLMQKQFNFFLKCIKKKNFTVQSFKDSLKVVNIISQIKKSNNNNHFEKLK